MNPDVRAAFDAFPQVARAPLLIVRDLILQRAASTDGVGELTETLKWGEPAYLTSETGAGTTIRLGWKCSRPDHYAIYLNCQTTLVDTCRTLFPELAYEGNRAIVLPVEDPVPEATLAQCIEMALTYHLVKARDRRRRA